MRTTIDFGIDLGTTNSAIAMLQGSHVDIIRRENLDYTPSAVWLDKQGTWIVGQAAWFRADEDRGNAFREFKPSMGSAVTYTVARDGRQVKPEDLSAEILKQLKVSAASATPEPVTAAVVTVPADFDLDQVAATVRAAALAGLDPCLTYPEPMAAALAYGFQSTSKKVFWLVYDLGGGTFDAALVGLREGRMELIAHGGDRELGGKRIDEGLVDRLLAPALSRDYPLANFHRSNPQWVDAFAKLKRAAEEAKIQLSYAHSVEIRREYVCQDDRGDWVTCEFTLTRADVERIAAPLVRRSINLCRRVLAENRLAEKALEKLLLVGGPTLTPYLREVLADPREGLGIPLEFTLDPMTVVARGAALYAGSQLLRATGPRTSARQFMIELEYAPMGCDPDPPVGGRIAAPSAEIALAGYTVELTDTSPRSWRSTGRLELDTAGTFLTRVRAHPGTNTYGVVLRDPSGRQVEVQPDSFPYVWGITPDALPLIHSMGVQMANNQTDFFFAKGETLPAYKSKVHVTAAAVRRGDVLRIPVVEGENRRRANHNRSVGWIEIRGDDLGMDLPAGSEVEIRIEIDASRKVVAVAYIPVLNQEFEQKMATFGSDMPAVEHLSQEAARQQKRWAELSAKVDAIGDAAVRERRRQVVEEQLLGALTSSLVAAAADPEAAARCRNQLLRLAGALDEIAAALAGPALRAETEEAMQRMHSMVRLHGGEADRQEAGKLEHAARRALELGDEDVVQLKLDDIRRFIARLVREKPAYWSGLLNQLKTLVPRMADPEEVARLIAQGARAVASEDLPGLRNACIDLLDLLPSEGRQEVEGGTISLDLRASA